MSEPLEALEVELAIRWLYERAEDRGYDRVTIAGVSHRGCADAHMTEWLGAMRHRAHAHTDPRTNSHRWICLKGTGAHWFATSSGMPTALARHEYAHLLAPSDNSHGKAWRRAVTALGAPAEARKAAKRSEVRKARAANTVWYWRDLEGVQRSGTSAEYRKALAERAVAGS